MTSNYEVPRITAVSAELTDHSFEVRWEADGAPPSTGKGTFLLSLFVQTPGVIRQYGLKFVDEEDPVVFVFDHGLSEQETRLSAKSIVGSEARQIVVHFPVEWISGLHGRIDSYGMVNVDGVDLGEKFEITIQFPR